MREHTSFQFWLPIDDGHQYGRLAQLGVAAIPDNAVKACQSAVVAKHEATQRAGTCHALYLRGYAILSPIIRSNRMSDPRELHEADPHPVSGHRTPLVTAEDEAGTVGAA